MKGCEAGYTHNRMDFLKKYVNAAARVLDNDESLKTEWQRVTTSKERVKKFLVKIYNAVKALQNAAIGGANGAQGSKKRKKPEKELDNARLIEFFELFKNYHGKPAHKVCPPPRCHPFTFFHNSIRGTPLATSSKPAWKGRN